MPSPGFRTCGTFRTFSKLTMVLAIVAIVAQPVCGFTLDLTKAAEAGRSIELVAQESVQVKNVINSNDIKPGKAANKEPRDKYRFSREEISKELMENEHTELPNSSTETKRTFSQETTDETSFESTTILSSESVTTDGYFHTTNISLATTGKKIDVQLGNNSVPTVGTGKFDSEEPKINDQIALDSESPSSGIRTTVLSIDTSKSQRVEFETSESIHDNSESALTIVDEVTKPSITAEPVRKEYTTIDRKRSEVTNNDEDKDKSEKTTLPIPPLEVLREDQLSNSYQYLSVREPVTEDIIETMPTSGIIDNTYSESFGTLSSKRAGFLDYSQTTSENYENSGTDSNTGFKNDEEARGQLSAYGSHNQMVDDATREEELLQDKKIREHDVLTRQNEDAQVNQTAEPKTKDDSVKIKPLAEDALSVQPIYQDRRTTTLYTVGPNYRPMKRIEVQPAKLLVRDPDDNSWRNESISSLGIVFKPKNSSSKSFKEVLKTKSEKEINNLQEKDGKEDTPELRQRLEKIAEVRKKKKKINKDGEVVYTDYEEGSSAEGIISPKAESNTEPSSDSEIDVTSPMTTTGRVSYWKNQLDPISRQQILRDLGMDIHTTQKPKKPYNIAEYYDTTDEYDADYITLPDVDIKKFTLPFKTTTVRFRTALPSPTSPSTLPPTSTRSQPQPFPERRPTVHYFPPTTKPPKIVMNEYDVNFENRVKEYTLKQTPATTPTYQYEVARTPTTIKHLGIRPTPKPSDLMFTPRNPLRGTWSAPRIAISDPGLERGSYIIRHLGDFLSRAAAAEEDAASPEFPAFTQAPASPLTEGSSGPTHYNYESPRRDPVTSFVDSFNRNSERFKADFPVLFNTSVVHGEQNRGSVASSNTFLKRQYASETASRAPLAPAAQRDCPPDECDKMVELSPAYELHYYVPEQEERGESEGVDPPAPLQPSYTLEPPYTYKL